MDWIISDPNANSDRAAKYVLYISYNFTALHQISPFIILLIKSNDYLLTPFWSTTKRRDQTPKWIWYHLMKLKNFNWLSWSHTIGIKTWRVAMSSWCGLLLIYAIWHLLKKRRSSPTRSFAPPHQSFSSPRQSICASPLTLLLPLLVGEVFMGGRGQGLFARWSSLRWSGSSLRWSGSSLRWSL